MSERTKDVSLRWPLPAHDYWSTPFAESLLQHLNLSPGASILDIASGHGIPAFYLAEQVGPTGRVLAIDLSGRQVESARAIQERNFRGCGSNVWICAHCLSIYPVSTASPAISPSCFFAPIGSRLSRGWWNISNQADNWF